MEETCKLTIANHEALTMLTTTATANRPKTTTQANQPKNWGEANNKTRFKGGQNGRRVDSDKSKPSREKSWWLQQKQKLRWKPLKPEMLNLKTLES